MRKQVFVIVYGLCLLFVWSGCSLTKNLPEGEVLYTGRKTVIKDESKTVVGGIAVAEVLATLSKDPSTKMFGFLPIPFKVWAYNDFVKSEKGPGRWMFDRLVKVPPVFISTINPEVRTKIATSLLHDYGYFNGEVNYEVIASKKNNRKADVKYTVTMNQPYIIDTVYYHNFSDQTLRIIERGRRFSYLNNNRQFNLSDLNDERTRIAALLRNRGYFYFRPDYMKYQADTTVVSGPHISLRLAPIPGLPEAAQRQFYIGRTAVSVLGKKGELPTDTMRYRDIEIAYHHKLRVRPDMLYSWINDKNIASSSSTKDNKAPSLYTQSRQERIQEKLSQLGIFKMIDLQYIPRDSVSKIDTLDLNLQLALDKPLDAELLFNVTTKSNKTIGPGMSFGLTRNNVFGGGESWNVKAKGSYEWFIGETNKNSLLNSWEMELSSSLSFPRVVFPKFGGKGYDFPATSTFKVYVNQLNRAIYYKLLSFGGSVTYSFHPTALSTHSLIPFRLSFNVLQGYTETFREEFYKNPNLYISLKDQFVPAIEYTYTYDNSSLRRVKHPIWWQSTIVSAGNLTSCIYSALGQSFSKPNKTLWNVPFAQFVKLNSELRYLHHINKNNSVAARVGLGAIFSYGNSTIPPFNEQFSAGGANSVRAFSTRDIGPGGFQSTHDNSSLWEQTGTFRFEANAEYRFKVYKNFWGAAFLDAGNVWLLRKDEKRPDSQLRMETFVKQIALGTGLGFRYNMDILIFRFDIGVPLHCPYDTGKTGYYNPSGGFFSNLAYHFAIGYPF